MKRTINIIITCMLLFIMPAAITYADNHRAANKQHQEVSQEKFRALFKGYLCEHLDKEEPEIIISRFKVMGNEPLPRGKLDFRLFKRSQRELSGYVKLTCIIRVNRIAENEVRLSGWADVFGNVVCPSRDIERGEVIGREDVYLARKNISRLSSGIVTDVREVTGLMAKHNLRADVCIKDYMLERKPVVERGDMVTILAESSGLRLTVPGRIQEDGYSGERVKVRNTMSKKEIYAMVVNGSTVRVEF